MDRQDKRLNIIQAVGRGEISVEDGAKQLEALETGFPALEASPDQDVERKMPVGEARDLESDGITKDEADRRYNRLKNLWLIPFFVGMVLMIFAGVWMAASWERNGLGWGFWLSWIPLILGIFVLVLSWNSRNIVWLHIRIRQKHGDHPRKIAISLPLPLGLAGWILNLVLPFLPDEMKHKITLEGLQELAQKMTTGEPIQVFVRDEDGEQVEVYIG